MRKWSDLPNIDTLFYCSHLQRSGEGDRWVGTSCGLTSRVGGPSPAPRSAWWPASPTTWTCSSPMATAGSTPPGGTGGWLGALVQRRDGHVKPGSPVSAVARDPNHLDVFVTGGDGRIYATRWGHDPNGWEKWFNVSGGKVKPGSPSAPSLASPITWTCSSPGNYGLIYSTWGGRGEWLGAVVQRLGRPRQAWIPGQRGRPRSQPPARVRHRWRRPHLRHPVADDPNGWEKWFNVSGGKVKPGLPDQRRRSQAQSPGPVRHRQRRPHLLHLVAVRAGCSTTHGGTAGTMLGRATAVAWVGTSFPHHSAWISPDVTR